MSEELAGYKYKGEDIIFLVELELDTGAVISRPFDQTGGSHSITNDAIEVSTKDRTGSDYGETTESISLEGEVVYDDPFIPGMKKAIRSKKFVKIYEVDLKTDKAEYGMYKINDFNREFGHGDFATYSLDADLFGNSCEITLTEIPDGAPSMKGMDCDGEDDNGGVEG